jgi:hypothetical protein
MGALGERESVRRERRDSHRTLVDLWGVGLWVPSGAASERKPQQPDRLRQTSLVLPYLRLETHPRVRISEGTQPGRTAPHAHALTTRKLGDSTRSNDRITYLFWQPTYSRSHGYTPGRRMTPHEQIRLPPTESMLPLVRFESVASHPPCSSSCGGSRPRTRHRHAARVTARRRPRCCTRRDHRLTTMSNRSRTIFAARPRADCLSSTARRRVRFCSRMQRNRCARCRPVTRDRRRVSSNRGTTARRNRRRPSQRGAALPPWRAPSGYSRCCGLSPPSMPSARTVRAALEGCR